MMTRLQELLSISSEPLADRPATMPALLKDFPLGPDVFAMLEQKNGFYAFESSLHVFPILSDSGSGLEGWNAYNLWRNEYKDLANGLLFFGEDIFQDQFCLSPEGVLRFDAETAKTEYLADSLESWANLILSGYSEETGWKLAHEWQSVHGPIPRGKRLMPKIPFFLGGQYRLDNLWLGNPLEGMRFKADIAIQTCALPDGTKIRLKVIE